MGKKGAGDAADAHNRAQKKTSRFSSSANTCGVRPGAIRKKPLPGVWEAFGRGQCAGQLAIEATLVHGARLLEMVVACKLMDW